MPQGPSWSRHFPEGLCQHDDHGGRGREAPPQHRPIKFTWHNIDFIKFNTNEIEYNDIKNIGDSVKFTVIGRLSINEYNGNKTPQVMIENIMYESSEIKKKFVF